MLILYFLLGKHSACAPVLSSACGRSTQRSGLPRASFLHPQGRIIAVKWSTSWSQWDHPQAQKPIEEKALQYENSRNAYSLMIWVVIHRKFWTGKGIYMRKHQDKKKGETQKPAERSQVAEYFWKIRAWILNLGWYLPGDRQQTDP